jgi:GT2 family glycosyltransferase
MIKKTVGEQVNWFDEDYFWYGDDLDLCFRVKAAGFKVLFVPDVSVTHYKGAASGLKSHSAHVSKADKITKRLATGARFAVMRIFYKKHYLKKYPQWLTLLVLTSIKLKEKLTFARL